MFDIGWTELLVLAVIAILIVGPKDLPRMLYSLGQALGKMRRQADDFRRQFNESMRDAGMDDVRNDMKKMSDLNPANQIRNEIESTFRDDPTRSSGTSNETQSASTAPGETEGNAASAAEPSEGDIIAGSEKAEASAEPATAEPTPADDETPSERNPVGNRNANGAAEAKDAVS